MKNNGKENFFQFFVFVTLLSYKYVMKDCYGPSFEAL